MCGSPQPACCSQCEFAAVSEQPFLLQDVGLGLHNDIPQLLGDSIDDAILEIVQNGVMEE